MQPVAAVDQDAAVSAALTGATRRHGRCPLDVQLEVRPGIDGADPAAGLRLDETVPQFPLWLAAAAGTPFGEVRTVEEHDRVGGRGRVVAEALAGSDDGRLGSIRVMQVPWLAGEHGRVFESVDLFLCLCGGGRGQDGNGDAAGDGGFERVVDPSSDYQRVHRASRKCG